ncbi:hypothetical protein APUTEX25_004047 [Auxenochlorella protothecoides]|uniref:Uncharacterized protein n=1 Tax=Auxenochlorella protothecoides TaxID=3075 RepID=A0A3M7L394_AUXPR|nr:hypothetical protein APUTEX25_004047 [Auxenochlorella protothecoides]|eukprot:RMZ57213.1 hypothetical protein APUTEX25_004047 [Auxenochlorella protothecoides]
MPGDKRPRITVDEEARMAELETQLFRGEEDVAAELLSTGDPQQLPVYQDCEPTEEARAPAWHDPQDASLRVNVADVSRARKLRQRNGEKVLDGAAYSERLRAQHAKLNPRVGWARRGARAEAGPDSETAALLQRSGGLLVKGRALPAGQLEASRMRDANAADPAQGVLRALQYHPNGQLLLTASLDKRLRFFAVDGDACPLVQSLFLEDLPVHAAAFAAGGRKVLATGRRKYFYVADLESATMERIPRLFGTQDRSLEGFVASAGPGLQVVAFLGDDGTLPLMSLATRQLVGTLKMNGSARSGAFSSDGMELYTSGGDGAVYIWDLRQRSCRARFVDEGSLRGTSLALSPDDSLLAAGSSSGVVNVYGREQILGDSSDPVLAPSAAAADVAAAFPRDTARPPPRHSALNLTTTIDSLAFSPDGQVLAMASRMKRDALRLLHVPSGTVFSNWPTSRSPLGYVHCLDFSPGGGSLAIGNAKGRVVLYRLHHYPQA